METILVPPLLCSSRVYESVVDTVWAHGAVTLADTRRDDTIAAMAARILLSAPARFVVLGTSMGGHVALEVMRQALRVEEGHFDALVDAAFPDVVAERSECTTQLAAASRRP